MNKLLHLFRETAWNIPEHLLGNITRLHSKCYALKGRDDYFYVWLEAERKLDGTFDVRNGVKKLPHGQMPERNLKWYDIKLMPEYEKHIREPSLSLTLEQVLTEISAWERDMNIDFRVKGAVVSENPKIFSRRALTTLPPHVTAHSPDDHHEDIISPLVA